MCMEFICIDEIHVVVTDSDDFKKLLNQKDEYVALRAGGEFSDVHPKILGMVSTFFNSYFKWHPYVTDVNWEENEDQVKDYEKECENVIIRIIQNKDASEILSMINLYDKFQSTNILKAICEYVSENFVQLSTELLQLCEHDFDLLFSNENLSVFRQGIPVDNPDFLLSVEIVNAYYKKAEFCLDKGEVVTAVDLYLGCLVKDLSLKTNFGREIGPFGKRSIGLLGSKRKEKSRGDHSYLHSLRCTIVQLRYNSVISFLNFAWITYPYDELKKKKNIREDCIGDDYIARDKGNTACTEDYNIARQGMYDS
ncbi:Hypothetical predicted protein [Mytilus galloprovincialis]|uniref:Uncharacterized protein n=1 Tax=Mytilus galloprovincialis TaxID=29158 RepID=A0A8B6CXN2_MYTGA|nr:Hypothetical predicted protein [Mytilus galloprovincialis]